MIDEALPELTKAPVPVQTHALGVKERLAKGRALRDVAARNAQQGDRDKPGAARLVGSVRRSPLLVRYWVANTAAARSSEASSGWL